MHKTLLGKQKRNTGFTLLELVIVVALVALVSSILFASFSALNNKQILDSQVSLIKSTIQKVRLESLNSKNGSTHGIAFASTTFTVTNQSTTTTQVLTLSSGVSLAAHTLGTSSIIFSKVTGLPNASGTLTYTLTRGGIVIATSSFSINGIGVIQ